MSAIPRGSGAAPGRAPAASVTRRGGERPTSRTTKSGVRVPQVAVAPASRSLPEGRYYEAMRLLDARARAADPTAPVPGWHSSTAIWHVIVDELESRRWSRSTVTQRLGQLRDEGRVACEAVIVPDAIRGQQGLRYRLFAEGETSAMALAQYEKSIALVREEQTDLRRTARARAYVPPPNYKRLTINVPRGVYEEALRLRPRRAGMHKIGAYVVAAIEAYNDLTAIECPTVLPQTRAIMDRLGRPTRPLSRPATGGRSAYAG